MLYYPSSSPPLTPRHIINFILSFSYCRQPPITMQIWDSSLISFTAFLLCAHANQLESALQIVLFANSHSRKDVGVSLENDQVCQPTIFFSNLIMATFQLWLGSLSLVFNPLNSFSMSILPNSSSIF